MINTAEIITYIHNDKIEKIEELTKEEVNSFYFEGNTLLHYVSQISLQLSKVVLPKMNNINEVNILDKTALHYCKNKEIKNYFLQQGMFY